MRDVWLRLLHAGLHPDRLRSLLAAAGSAERLLSRLRRGAAGPAVQDAVSVEAAARREQLARLGARLVLREDPGYPERLRSLPDAPPGLFVRGTLPTAPTFAVVGTRRCTAYGREIARSYGEAVAAAGWVLASGLARGIDGAAHRGTVSGAGRGVAVLGCGIDVRYPREHAGLAAALLDHGGGVVTEYPPGTAPEGWRFPPRNRIIAGMAIAVVVVEAGITGGALVTAGRALEYGIPVFAVPGDVDRASSRGCNLLIRDGAHPVLDAEDLVAELGLLLGARTASTASRVEP